MPTRLLDVRIGDTQAVSRIISRLQNLEDWGEFDALVDCITCLEHPERFEETIEGIRSMKHPQSVPEV